MLSLNLFPIQTFLSQWFILFYKWLATQDDRTPFTSREVQDCFRHFSIFGLKKRRSIRCYTEAYKSCFLPYGISLLNDILSSKPTCLNDMSRACFKSFTNPKVKHNDHFDAYHTRKSQVLMARLRCNNADLNENLFSIKLSTSDICPKCGLHVETIELSTSG